MLTATGEYIPQVFMESHTRRSVDTFSKGDRVEIVEGRRCGCSAHILSVDGDRARLQMIGGNSFIQVPLRSLRRQFFAGDAVVVTDGVNARRWGYVVREYDGSVMIYSPIVPDTVSGEYTEFRRCSPTRRSWYLRASSNSTTHPMRYRQTRVHSACFCTFDIRTTSTSICLIV